MLARFLGELRRRGVFGTVVLYIVASWVLVQVVSELLPALNIPDFAIRYVWLFVLLCLPLAMLLGWRYDISREGIRRTATTTPGGAAIERLQGTDYLLLGGAALLTAGFAVVLAREMLTLQTAVPPTAALDRNSVAVLPLDNYTGDSEQQYFVSGLHESLTASLTAIRGLKVISRTSASAVAGTGRTLPEIGRVLGARNIIEGSVFRSGDRIRVTVQLIDALSDKHLWAENFERDLTDLLALQAELTRAIAQQIQVTLTPQEAQRLQSSQPVDPETYRLYLKGMYFLKQSGQDSIARGMPYLQQAVEADPANARAWAGLALGFNTIGHNFGEDAFPKAKAAARRALTLDEHSGEAWAALAEAQAYYDWNWAESDRSYRRALQLAPSLDNAHAHYAYLLALLGRWDEAMAHSLKARELSPLDQTWAAFAGWLLMVHGDLEGAEKQLQESLELLPGYPFGLWFLGDLYRIQGRMDEAIAIQESIPEGLPFRYWALGPTYAVAGRQEDALRVIETMSAHPGPKDNLFIAISYSALGDFDLAMRWLEKCYEIRLDWLPWIAMTQGYGGTLEGLRADPRFRDLIARLNIPPAPDA